MRKRNQKSPAGIEPSDLRKQAAKLLTEHTMPSLAQVLRAVAEARRKYRSEILAARERN